jgi:HNH endonuclease
MPTPRKPPPSLDRLRELFSYDPETGFFMRVAKPRQSKFPAGTIAGSKPSPHGYISLKIDGCSYMIHRLAWLFVHGTWPREIDHVNRIRDDNRLSNLRSASRSLNALNSKVKATNRSGVTGVNHVADCYRNPWRAFIMVNGNPITLGYFATKEQAAAARAAAFKAAEQFQVAVAVRNAAFEVMGQLPAALQLSEMNKRLKLAERYLNAAAA